MTSENNTIITLGADVGGTDAFDATNANILALRKSLEAHGTTTYGGDIKEIALVLRIDGKTQAWEKQGTDNIRHQPKSGVLTADIFMLTSDWNGLDDTALRKSLADKVTLAIDDLSVKLQQKDANFDTALLKHNVKAAIREYLEL